MRQLSLLLTAIGLTLICACGKPLAAPADPAPFKAAVADYCRAKNYGMTIASITALEPTGDTATMTCRMQDNEGLYGVGVTWQFSLRREKDGWTVTGHKTQ